MMLLENHQQPSGKINRRIKIVSILPIRIKIKTEKNYSAHIAVGEIKKNCFKLKKKEQPANSTQLKKNVLPSSVASVSEPPKNFEDTIAFVDTKKIVTNNTILKISKIGKTSCNLVALLNMGSIYIITLSYHVKRLIISLN